MTINPRQKMAKEARDMLTPRIISPQNLPVIRGGTGGGGREIWPRGVGGQEEAPGRT